MVSVVITFYNGEKYAASCVESVIDQECDGVELILVNDSSTDGTIDVLRQFESHRVKVIDRRINGGASESRFSGLVEVKTPYVLFMDGDDMLCKGALKSLLFEAEKSQADITFGHCIFTTSPEDKRDVLEEDYIACEVEGIEDLYLDRNYDNTLIGKLYRTDFLKQLHVEKNRGICPHMFFEDYLCTTFFFDRASKIVVTNRPIWCHRDRDLSVSKGVKLIGWHFDHIYAGEIVLKYLEDHGLKRIRSRELTRYISVISRVYCLLEVNKVEDGKKTEYEESIVERVKRYYREYYNNGEDSLVRKVFFKIFTLNPQLWRRIVLNTYYRKYKTT